MDVDDILTKYSDSDKKEESPSQEKKIEGPKEVKPEGEPEKKEYVRRKPSVWKLIENVTKEDGRVRIVGIVTEVDKDSGVLNIDDGKSITVISTPDQVKNLNIGQKVGIIGMVVPFSENVELRAEIIQDFDKIDMVLYKKFMEFMKGK